MTRWELDSALLGRAGSRPAQVVSIYGAVNTGGLDAGFGGGAMITLAGLVSDLPMLADYIPTLSDL